MQEIVYHTNYKLEDSYWWFVVKFQLVRSIIKKYCNLPANSTIIDIGCGTGGFSSKIADEYNVLCLDTSPIALEYCQKRGLKNLYNLYLEDFPKDKYQVQAATMLDVVEHIDDDKKFIGDVYNLLAGDGWVVVTVPAYQWLWSTHDEIHHHKRRYSKKQIVDLLKNSGFKPVFSSYFNTLLFPAAVLKRFIDKISGKKHGDSPVDEVSPFINNLFKRIFKLEISLLKFLRFPFGVSIIVVAQKNEVKPIKK